MGGVGAVAEPLVVVALLIIGTWINRDSRLEKRGYHRRRESDGSIYDLEDLEKSAGLLTSENSSDGGARSLSPSLLEPQEPRWRTRRVGLGRFKKQVTTPNTRRFRSNLLSRILKKFPFLVECWYWALIYWVYQLGRAATAVLLVDSTVDAARDHALQVIALEQKLHIFVEVDIQRAFMRHPLLMTWINRIYSYIHIPGSIAFLIWLFYNCHRKVRRDPSSTFTDSRPSLDRAPPKPLISVEQQREEALTTSPRPTPQLYQSRRRTMALSILLAFVIFTLWPCMPPRLLPADTTSSTAGDTARSYGFIDTVHRNGGGDSSIWTQNRFCNQYAAMPSLHFGYALLIGLTILTTPLASDVDATAAKQNGGDASHNNSSSGSNSNSNTTNARMTRLHLKLPLTWVTLRVRLPSWQRALCVFIGVAYPSIILVAILATANHIVLDAVAGAVVCGVAWWGNGVLLNLCVLEDWFLWVVRVHRPELGGSTVEGEDEDGFGYEKF